MSHSLVHQTFSSKLRKNLSNMDSWIIFSPILEPMHCISLHVDKSKLQFLRRLNLYPKKNFKLVPTTLMGLLQKSLIPLSRSKNFFHLLFSLWLAGLRFTIQVSPILVCRIISNNWKNLLSFLLKQKILDILHIYLQFVQFYSTLVHFFRRFLLYSLLWKGPKRLDWFVRTL